MGKGEREVGTIKCYIYSLQILYCGDMLVEGSDWFVLSIIWMIVYKSCRLVF